MRFMDGVTGFSVRGGAGDGVGGVEEGREKGSVSGRMGQEGRVNGSHGAVGSATRLSKTCILQRDDSVVSCVSSENEGSITMM